ncbi:DNA cytosine methyltransferase [Orbus mooreae]|uniref:DNA cytosine methyltransferase n=1 Tax=Orbus mooreae TaxID=3074107 RepID=UPI00370D4B17
MNVLSLFDGISCGRVALDRANIKVSKYYASEIDKTAIKISENNHSDIEQIGNVNDIQSWNLPTIDLLLGGSPCQDFSRGATISNKVRTGLKGDRSNLFWKYLEAKHKFNPKYFLLENVVMPKEHEEIITMSLGVEPIKINSNLVSFQNRERLYWTNIPGVSPPEDRSISFQDYKDTNFDYCSQFKVNQTASRLKMWGDGVSGNCPNVTYRNKVNCVTLKQDRHKNSGLIEFDGFCRYLTRRELELSQTLNIGYTDSVSYNQACKAIGNGWTVDVIAHILSSMEK